jgi:DNA-binding SARP family transcriptional activator/tetratricopeptide (TPR) repeat protein
VLRISLLGEQAITDEASGDVRTRSSRAVALVAFLIVHAATPQTRQRIAGQLWPDSADAQALTNLRRELHHLRQVLGDEGALVVTSTHLCWRDTDTCHVDVRLFDLERGATLAAAATGDDDGVLAHGAAAIGQYRGEFLPGAYDDWLLEVRSELQQECVDLCDLVSETRRRCGDLAGAVSLARRRVSLQPLEEVGYRTLMRLQAEMGDRAGAVSTYHHCESVLERELGIVPDKATRALLERVLVLAEPRDATQPPSTAERARSGLAAAALVGRSAELDQLHDLWRDAAAGRPGLVIVRGGAGVGKTRLVEEVAQHAQLHGAVVAATQCFGAGGRLALTPVADWLRHPAVQAAAGTLDPAWRAEVERLVPSQKTRGERGAGSRAMVDAWQRHRFFEGIARGLLGVERPLLLILDNLQWCDQESLAFLTFLVALAPDSPILVAATLRDDEIDDDRELAAWTVRARATGRLTELTLGPFDVEETARLAAAIAGRPLPEADAELLQATTGGFPLYVVEAVRATVDTGGSSPPAGEYGAALANRLTQTTSSARDVAGLAAAVGTNFGLDLLIEASDLDADTVVHAVDELWRRRIVRELGDGYDFAHDLLRDAAYAQVSPPRRWLLHRRIAQGLELLHIEDLDGVSAQLAAQNERGGRPERAVAYYRRAADVAAGRFAHAEAIRLHRQALAAVRSLPAGVARDRQELEVLRAMTAPLNARQGYASPDLQEAVERTVVLAESLDERDATLAGLVTLWMSRFVQGRIAESYATSQQALRLVDPATEASGPAHFAVAGSAVGLGRLTEALHHFDLAVSLTSDAMSLTVGTRQNVHGLAFAAHVYWLLGRDEDAAREATDAIALARAIDHHYSLAVALAYGAVTAQMRGDAAELGGRVAELSELCDRYGFAYYREWGLVLGGWAEHDQAGIDLARRGINNLKAETSLARMPYWLSLLADLLGRLGHPQDARATLDAAVVAAQAHDDVWWLPEVLRMRAAYDDDGAAVARLRSAARIARYQGSVALLRRCARDLAERGVPLAAPDGLPAP